MAGLTVRWDVSIKKAKVAFIQFQLSLILFIFFLIHLKAFEVLHSLDKL